MCVWGGGSNALDFGGSAADTSDENIVHKPIKKVSAVTQDQVEDVERCH